MSFIVLAVLLLAAIAFDIRERRIPNILVAVGIALAAAIHTGQLVLYNTAVAGSSWWAPLGGALTGFLLLLPLHAMRAMGAGDVKLMSMVGAFIGPIPAATAVAYALVAGGVLSLVYMTKRGVAMRTAWNLKLMFRRRVQVAKFHPEPARTPLESTAARLPYALAISFGTVAALRWPLAAP
jgi:prepilin peptidase CpaA